MRGAFAGTAVLALLLALGLSGCSLPGGCQPTWQAGTFVDETEAGVQGHLWLEDGSGEFLFEEAIQVPPGRGYWAFGYGPDNEPAVPPVRGDLVANFTVEGSSFRATMADAHCVDGWNLHYDGSRIWFGPDSV